MSIDRNLTIATQIDRVWRSLGGYSMNLRYLLLCLDTLNLMNWQSRMTIDPNISIGKPTIKGTRLAVEFIVDLLAQG